MIDRKQFTFQSNNGETRIHAVMWIPNTKQIRAILQISHGMVEYIERYEEFADFFANRGILVVGHDHLGHGGSIRGEGDFGYFAPNNGNEIIIKDMRKIQLKIREDYKNIPYFLLGHSMGSFFARQFIGIYGKDLDGVIICGTANKSPGLAFCGMILTKILSKIKGDTYRSNFVYEMMFGNYNNKFKPIRSAYDWLTKDEKIVDIYLRDKRSQFRFTLNAYHELFQCLFLISKKKLLKQVPHELPVFFIAGKDDPVGDFGKGVTQVYKAFLKIGIKDVSMKLYENDRHEILNETDRVQIYEDILHWLTLKEKK